MKTTAILLATLVLGACAAARDAEPLLSLHSADVGFTQIEMQARETRRNERGSAVEFSDTNPDQGSKLTKGIFRLRFSATLAARRGFDYFVILDKSPDERDYLLGMLPRRDADFAAAFGEAYATVPREGILEVQRLAPFELP